MMTLTTQYKYVVTYSNICPAPAWLAPSHPLGRKSQENYIWRLHTTAGVFDGANKGTNNVLYYIAYQLLLGLTARGGE